jgi:hypothetical protein
MEREKNEYDVCLTPERRSADGAAVLLSWSALS